MSSKSDHTPANTSLPEGLRQYHYRFPDRDPALEYEAHLLLEAKIDFSDVRSGFHLTDSVSAAVAVYPDDPDMLLTEDMVLILDPDRVAPDPPAGARLAPLSEPITPESIPLAESRFVSFLLRCHKAKVFRNFGLNVYSLPGESAGDFQKRCLEKFNESFRKELDGLREVINRKMELLKDKHLAVIDPGELISERLLSRERGRFREVWEKLTEMFLKAELTGAIELPRPDPGEPSGSDLDERLYSVSFFALREARRLQAGYREQALNIDEYIIRPNLKDVYLGRTSILWIPRKALSR